MFGVVGTLLGIGGLAVAMWSGWAARRANDTADEALRLSQLAEARNDKLAAIQTEYRDVRWVGSAVENDTVTFRNVGTTPALRARLIARPAGFPDQERPAMDVAPGENIGWRVVGVIREHRDKHDAGPGAEGFEWAFEIDCQLIWESPAGATDSWSETLVFSA